MPHFDSSISLGSLIALGTILLTFHRYHMANVKRFMELEFRVKQMWSIFRKRFDMEDTHHDWNGDDNDNGN